MTRYSRKDVYKVKPNPVLSDRILATDSETQGEISIQIQLSDIKNLLVEGLTPETGGNLKFQEFIYNGAPKTPEEVANFKNPAYAVGQYEVVFFNINGVIYVLRKQNFSFGVTETPITNADFILITDFGKLGDGTNVLKGYNVVTKQFEFYGIKSTGLDISIVTGNIIIDPKEGTNLGDGQIIYKGLNATSKLDEYYCLKSTGLDISLSSDNIIVERKASTKLGATGIDVYKGLNTSSKLDEFRKIKSDSLTITLDADGVKIEKNESYVQAGDNVTVTGTGTQADPYIIAADKNAGWEYGDTKFVFCDSTYKGVNFDSTGLGRINRVDWAICNGNNGTPNDNGLIDIAYGTDYPTLNATLGSKDAVAQVHLANGVAGDVDGSHPAYPIGTSLTGTNIQPSVVRLKIMYIGT
jgi:hypothetical protein